MIHNVDPQLSQWDVGRIVSISDSNATHIHFANQGDSKAVIIEIENGSAKIPDYLLQTGKTVIAYAVYDGVTLESRSFSVRKRERPENYVYEDDQRNYIYKLISDVETAVANANLAAEGANLASESANAAARLAGVATNIANQATTNANEASNNANLAAKQANDAAVKAAQTAKSLMVIGEAQDTSITLDDAIDQFLVGLRIFGKTTQDGTPTPDAPVDLVSVGGGGAVGVVVTGKNLLDLSKFTDRSQSGASITNNKNGSITIVTDGTYTGYYNGAVAVSIPSGRYRFVETSSYKYAFVRLFAKGTQTYTQYNTGTVFEYDRSVQDIKFYVQCDPGEKVSATLWPMIYIATETDNAYEPYKAQTLNVSTPNGLPGIPVTSGGNYTDANGQQWICDEIDFVRGVFVKRTALVDSSTLEWTLENQLYWTTKTLDDCKYVSVNTIVGNALWEYGTVRKAEGMSISRAGELAVDTTKISCNNGTLEEKPRGLLLYELVSPIETPLSEEELAAYANLHTYKDHTTVSNDAGAWMDLEYVMDARKYIDNMILGTVIPATVE